MAGSLKQHWRELRKGHPGRRFQERYERKRHEREGRSGLRGLVQPAVGVLLLAVGMVLCVIPGPGVPLLLIGAATLAERSLSLARTLDWSELKLRSILRSALAFWRGSIPSRKA